MCPFPARADDHSWGFGVRYGTFGIPNRLADQWLDEHPGIRGTIRGAEIRYYGAGGPDGIFSVGVGLDYGSTFASGTWKKDPEDTPVVANGEISLAAATLTLYWDLWPTIRVHPFLGIGFGYAKLDGSYEENSSRGAISESIPAVHIPIGLTILVGEHLSVRAEARIINAVSFGGQLMFNF